MKIAYLGLLFLSATTLALAGQASEDARLLEGTWLPTTAELDGKPLPDGGRQAMKLTIAGDKYTVHVGEKTDKGTVKLDAAKTPRAMDITGTDGPNQGRTILAIYEVGKDELKVCYDLTGKDRPTEFKAPPDSKRFLVTYKREKP